MKFAKAIIGNEVIGLCVKHKEKESKNNILDRPVRVVLRNRSGKRTGRISEAFVNSEIKKVSGDEVYYSTNIKPEILDKLKIQYNEDFEVRRKGAIKGRQIIGECSEIPKKTKIPKHAACHQGQKIYMRCKNFVLCYVNIAAEPSYTKF